MRPEIKPAPSTPSLRALRMRRLAQRWVEQGGDLRETPLEVVQAAAVALAEERGRDLDEPEVAKVARETVASWVDQREQREAEEAIASARREADARARDQYLARQAAHYRLLAGEKSR